MAEEKGVQSVQRIFALLELLAASPRGAGLQKLAEGTGLAKSTVHRLLASLVQLGYVAQDPETSQYRLTLKLFELSSSAANQLDLMGIAKPHLDRLSATTGEAVHLVLRDDLDIVYIYKAESGNLRMSSHVGLRAPLYCTGVGKAILSSLPAAEVQRIWNSSDRKKLTAHTITELPALERQLRAVRANGFAIDDEENELGIRCVALPIPGPDGRAQAAFSISSLVPHMSEERIAEIARISLETRAAILRDLGL